MKRIYIAPEIKFLHLQVTTLLEGSNNPSNGQSQVDGKTTGDGTTDPEGGDGSRSWGHRMWEDME